MADTPSAPSTPGGVVNIQTIIDQIASVNSGLEKVVDAIQNTSNGVAMAVKVKKAQAAIKKSTSQLKVLIKTVDKALKDMLKDVKVDDLQKDMDKLVSDPLSLATLGSNPKAALTKVKGDKKAGILEQIIGICAAINLIGDIKVANPIKVKIKMKLIKTSLNQIGKELPGLSKQVLLIAEEGKAMGVSMKMLTRNPSNLITLAAIPKGTARETAIAKLGTGLFIDILALAAMVKIIGGLKIPGPIKVRLKMLKLRKSLGALSKSLRKLIEPIASLAIASRAAYAASKGIMHNPQSIIALAHIRNESTIAKLGGGIFTIILGLAAMIKVIGHLSVPLPILVKLKMKMIKGGVKALAKGLSGLVGPITRLRGASRKIRSIRQVKRTIKMLVRNIAQMIKPLTLLAMCMPLVAITMPIILLGMKALALGVRGIMIGIQAIKLALKGSRAARRAVRTMKRLTYNIIKIARNIALIAMLAILAAMVTPMAIMGIVGMAMGIRGILLALRIISGKGFVKAIRIVGRNVSRVMRRILRIIMYIAGTIAVIAIIILLCIQVGKMILQSFGPFIAGLLTMVVMFGLMALAMKGIQKMARRGFRAARGVIINMLLLCIVIMALCLILAMVSKVADPIYDRLWPIVVTLGLMGVVMLAMLGFMTIAGMVSPFVAAGVVAILSIMVGMLVLVVLIGLLWMISWIAGYLNEEEVKSNVQKVIDCTVAVIRAILDADMTVHDNKQGDTGLVGGILRFVGGGLFSAVFDLICKVVILFVAIMALGCIWVLAAIMLGITKMYRDNKADFEEAPVAVVAVIDCACKCIQALLDADTKSKFKEGDGLFLQLVTWVFGEDMAAIFKLLFKVIIVALSIIVLAMVKWLAQEILWVTHWVDEHRSELENAPQAVQDVVTCAGNVIQTLLNADTGSQMRPGQGIFEKLVSWVSPDLSAIVSLLFKVIIIALTMIVLAMIRCVLNELKWIYDSYTELGGKAMLTNVKNMTSGIIAAVTFIIGAIAGTSLAEANGSPKSGMAKLLNWLGLDTLATIVDLLSGYVFIGLAIFGLSSLLSLAKVMGESYDIYLKMGGQNIANNARLMVKGLVSGANAMIDALKNSRISFGEANADNVFDEALIKILKSMLGDGITGIAEFMEKSAVILRASKACAEVLVLAQVLEKSSDYAAKVMGKINQLPTRVAALGTALNDTITAINEAASGLSGYDQLQPSVDKINDVVDRIAAAFAKLTEGGKLRQFQGMPREVGRLTSSLAATVKTINQGADMIQGHQKLQANLNKIETVMRQIVTAFNRLLGISGNTSLFQELLKKNAQYAKVVADTDKLIARVNSIDLAKMESLAKMFGNAAAFSNSINGNFDRLANVINEKIAPLIEHLDKTIAEADAHIQQAAERAEAANRAAAAASARALEAASSAVSATPPPAPASGSTPAAKPAPRPASSGSGNQGGGKATGATAAEIAAAIANRTLKVMVTNL